MAIRYLLRSIAISLMIAIAFSTLQVAQAAPPDSQPIVEQGDTVGNLSSNTANLENNLAATTKFQALATSGQYSDVMGLVSHILDQGSEYGAETRASLVEPLMKLAMVQKQLDDYLTATRASELAMELIERNGGVFDPALVEPLVFLAQLEQDNGNHPAALERLYRAQHILHRTDGVMTQLQLPILGYMTKSYTAMKQTANASAMIEQAFAIKSRHLDQNSLEYVPIVLEQAEIRAMNGQFRTARELIYLALEILDRSLAENDPGFVDALNGLAFVRYLEQSSRRPNSIMTGYRLVSPGNTWPLNTGTPGLIETRTTERLEQKYLAHPPIRLLSQGRREGTRALRKMIRIMEEHRLRFSAIERAKAHIWLGDWYMIIHKPDLADGPYRAAWQILADEDHATELLASYFGQPKRLKYRKPATPRNGPGMYENYDGKYVEVRYSVDESGTVRNLKLADSNSPAAMNKELRSAVKRAIFRPRYADGQAVATDNLFFREEFAGMLWWLAEATDQ